MSFLKTLGNFVTECLQTNTFSKMLGDIADIWRGHKRTRGIICLTSLIVVGSGTGLAFVFDPAPFGYFQPIVLKALPFLGDIASKIAVGGIGFWLGGACGHNVAKQGVRFFCLGAFGHTNSAYIINDKAARKVINHNVQYFPPSGDKDVELAHVNADNDFVKKGLFYLRDQVDLYRGKDKIAYREYKDALLSLLEKQDVAPVISMVEANKARTDVKQRMIDITRRYLAQAAEYVGSLVKGKDVDPHSAQEAAPSREEIVLEVGDRLSHELVDMNVNIINLNSRQRRHLLHQFESLERQLRTKIEQEERLLPPAMRLV